MMSPTTTTNEQAVSRLYRARQAPELVEVPELAFLMIDGHGDPNTSPRYQAALAGLYSASYGLKFALKRAGAGDYRVAPLEGLWWVPDMTRFTIDDKSDWDWTMMIRQPDPVDVDLLQRVAGEVAAKKDLPTALELRLERWAEGRCAQVLHRGPFAAEGPTIAALHAFITGQGMTLRGKHHEIYLSDIRRAAPDSWKTIIRQPVTDPGLTSR
jgi:hypothetical protein